MVAGHVTQRIVEPTEWIGQFTIAFDTTHNVYLVAYSTYGEQIRGQWVGPDGVLRGAPFALVPGKYLFLKYTPGEDTFALNYNSGGKGKLALLRYQAINSYAWVTAAPIEVNTQKWGVDAYHYSAHIPSRGHHLVTWWDALVNAGQSFVRSVRADGTLGGIVTLTGNLADIFDTPRSPAAPGSAWSSASTTTTQRGASVPGADGSISTATRSGARSSSSRTPTYTTWSRWPTRRPGITTSLSGFAPAVRGGPGRASWRDTGFAKYTVTPTFGGTRLAYNGGSDSFSVFLNGWNYDVFAHELGATGTPVVQTNFGIFFSTKVHDWNNCRNRFYIIDHRLGIPTNLSQLEMAVSCVDFRVFLLAIPTMPFLHHKCRRHHLAQR